MPAAAAAVAAIASAGPAFSAIGAIATAGTAALTIGSVASIATFVGSTLAVVGALTGDDNLTRVGGILGVAGGVTSVAANSLKLFGESQTLSSAVNIGKAAEAGVGVKLESAMPKLPTTSTPTSTANPAQLGKLNTSLSSDVRPPSFGGVSADALSKGASKFGVLGKDSGLLGQVETSATGPTVPGLNLDKYASSAFSGVDQKFAALDEKLNNVLDKGAGAGAGAENGSIIDKVGKFFKDKDNVGLLRGAGDAGTALAKYREWETLDNYYNKKTALQQQLLRNASAAGRMYA